MVVWPETFPMLLHSCQSHALVGPAFSLHCPSHSLHLYWILEAPLDFAIPHLSRPVHPFFHITPHLTLLPIAASTQYLLYLSLRYATGHLSIELEKTFRYKSENTVPYMKYFNGSQHQRASLHLLNPAVPPFPNEFPIHIFLLCPLLSPIL